MPPNRSSNEGRDPATDDGDEYRFCSTCAFSQACLSEGMNKAALRDLHILVEHVGPLAPGQHVFREGEVFESIAAVREGTVKSYVVDPDGREQVLAFHFPGEIIGFNAIERASYPCNAVALDVVQLCRFSFSRIADLATQLPGLQKQLFRLMSRDIGNATLLAGDHSAEERLAAFLMLLSRRSGAYGPGGRSLQLTMPRTDIASHLRLAPETVSRVLRRFQDLGYIHVKSRIVDLVDGERLGAIAATILRG